MSDEPPTYPLMPDGKPSDGRGHHACESCLTESGIHCPATRRLGDTFLCRTCEREVLQDTSPEAQEYADMLAQAAAWEAEREDPVLIRQMRAQAEQFRHRHGLAPQ